MRRTIQCLFLLTTAGALAWAQVYVYAPRANSSMGVPEGKWWDVPERADRLKLTDEQKKKMDDVFQNYRIKLIDLRASLEKEEAILEPLVQADTPDDSKLLPQIDKVAQARAELEKADARLLLGIRHVLTAQQWQMLQAGRLGPRAGTVKHLPGR